ncbi:HAD family phosphatase [Alistipes sp. OttesenSCG-928-L06]|nr:HAD family phosphatase [Alistipes sp. OttesenSCG-928-L06]
MKSAVIFDMDGVLVDNRDIHIEAFQILFEKLGLHATYEQILMTFGMVNIEIFDTLFGEGRFSREEVERIAAEKEVIYRDIFAKKIEPAPGLIDLLKDLKAKGAKIAVGSSGPLVNVEFVLERCGIGSYFDAIANGDMISKGKPDPEVFLLAAQLLGKTPEECIVFEDALVGIEAGKRAGMTVIAMETTFPAERLEGSGYDKLIKTFHEVDASILEKF